jgi:pilus assembly protein FimV
MLSKRLTTRILALPLLAAALCGAPRAAELGEIKVNSHIGQQLSADIELVDLTAADLADIQARLANPDVFKGANVAMPPALGGLYISIAKRDNKRFLHLTTLQPVNAEALHLFLELNSGGRQIIRAASLWLTPEPPGQRPVTVAAMPAAEPVPLAAAAAKPAAPAPAAVSPPSQANSEAGLNEAAQRAFAHRQQVAMAKAREQSANPPPQPAPAAAPRPAAAAAAASAPAVTPAPSAAAAPSCAPAKQVEAQLRQCEAMTSKLADIEDKVQRLQIAAAAPAAAAATSASAPAVAAPKAEAAPAKPGAAPAKPGATPVKPGVAADLAANPRSRMMMIAGGVLAGLAALGGAIYFMRKRQAKGPLKIWQSFRKKGNAGDDVPVLEDAVEVAAH